MYKVQQFVNCKSGRYFKKRCNQKNQVLIIDEIYCKKEEFNKLGTKRYKVSFIVSNVVNGNSIVPARIELGNVGLEIDFADVEDETDYVLVKYAKMTVYSSPGNSFGPK